MNYSNKKLKELADSDLIWPKTSESYRLLLIEYVEQKGWDVSKLDDPNEDSNIEPVDLWYDLCEIINDLAQLVLDEREKRFKFLKELRQDLKNFQNQLSDKNYKNYY